MSLPNFDDEVQLEMSGGILPISADFTVRGPLSADEQSEIFRVLVSVWQTEEDSESPGTGVARALGEGQRDPDDATKWSARMTTVSATRFTPDRRATGLAHLVANNGDPTGFETYTWMSRLSMIT
jgi:hypothetical protein